jgi:very-short-patch-repair endonuclease
VVASDILEVIDRLPKLRRRRLIRTTAQDVAGGSETLSEIDLVRLCRRFGLPTPARQQRRTDAAGRVRYLDAYWPQWHLHVEIDGAHHMDAGQWEADMRRQNDIWVRGDRILRFPAFLARHRQAEVAEQIRRALVGAGWHP